MQEAEVIKNSVHQLLKEQEFVVIPEFGAFISNCESAKLQQFSIIPPSKKIIFNKNLQQDDGVLIQFISDCLKQEYLKSKLDVAKAVYGWKRSLAFGENISFDKLGTLNLNSSGHVEFTENKQAELQGAYFGLSNIQIKKLPIEEVKELKVTSIKSVESVVKNDNKTIKPLDIEETSEETIVKNVEKKIIPLHDNISNKFKWNDRSIAVAVSPFLFLGLGLIGAKTVSKQGDLNFASIFSWGDSKDKVVVVDEKLDNVPVESKIEKIQTAEDFFTSEELELINNSNNKTETTASDNNEVEETSSEVTPSTTYDYHLVAGCFSIIENAEVFVEQLKLKGFDARLIGLTKTGLYRVAYGSFNDKVKALRLLAKLKLNENKNTWLLNEKI